MFNVLPRNTVCAFLNVAVWGLWHIYGGTKCELHYTIWTVPFSISVRVRVSVCYIYYRIGSLDPYTYMCHLPCSAVHEQLLHMTSSPT